MKRNFKLFGAVALFSIATFAFTACGGNTEKASEAETTTEEVVEPAATEETATTDTEEMMSDSSSEKMMSDSSSEGKCGEGKCGEGKCG